ncbi:MAG: molybdenum cofactor carrier protein [Acidobacteria bacterium]|nr:molybdenum cofactor carrier protein [Acidobacteriota bacterium]
MTSSARRRPVVGVMGSSSRSYDELAEPLGRFLAGIGVHLLTGGGVAAMEAVSRAFARVSPRAGLVVGVLPSDLQDGGPVPRTGYPNQWVEIAIFTHLPLSGISGADARSRNHINVLSSDVVVALPGGEGTQSEVELAVRYGKPVIAFFGDQLVEWRVPDGVVVARDLAEVRRFVEARLVGCVTVRPHVC